jgi:fatty acid desaturase
VFPFGMDYHLPHHIYASVPHYKLDMLHELLLKNPEYAEKAVIVEGYFGHDNPETGRPTALSVLGPAHAPKTRETAYVDVDAIAHADVTDRAAIDREVELSRAG